MRVYSTFIICPESSIKELRLSDFATEKTVEIMRLGQSESIQHDCSRMLRSHLVVTVGDWWEDQKCVDAVSVARTMKMNVVHESQFEKYVKQNNY